MNKNTLKSIWAVLAGFIIVFALSYGTDFGLLAAGVLPKGGLPMYGSELLIITIIVYRSIYNVVGGYIMARLAPNHPMAHALTGGMIGFVLSLVGTIATRDMNLGPAWYAWAIVLVALPTAWLGGKLFLLTSRKRVIGCSYLEAQQQYSNQ